MNCVNCGEEVSFDITRNGTVDVKCACRKWNSDESDCGIPLEWINTTKNQLIATIYAMRALTCSIHITNPDTQYPIKPSRAARTAR